MSKYCEWKEEYLDTGKWKLTTACGHEVIETRNNKYGKIRMKDGSKCPFCGKEHNVCCYD